MAEECLKGLHQSRFPISGRIDVGVNAVDPHVEGLHMLCGLSVDGAADEGDHVQKQLRGCVILLVLVQVDIRSQRQFVFSEHKG